MSDMDVAIKLRAEGSKKLAAEINQLGKGFKDLSKELKDTNTSAAKVQNLYGLNKSFAQSQGKIKKTKTELAGLRKEIKAADSPSQKLLKTFREKEKQLGRLVNAQAKEKTKLRELGSELKKTGVDTKNLKKENDRYTASVKKTSSELGKFAAKQKQIQDTRTRKLQNSANLGFAGAGMMMAGRFVSRAINAPISKIKQVERSKGELQSIMGKDGAQQIVDEGRKQSGKIAGITTAGFTSAAYTIKSSMSSLSAQAVANMTAAAAVTAKATKSDLATMTELYAKGSGVFKTHLFKDMSDSEFGDVFGSAVARTVQNFNTTGLKMASAIRTAGEGASMAGISMGEQMAVLGMAQQVLTAEQSGTAYMALLRNPVAAQKKLAKAGHNVELLDDSGNVKKMPEMLTALETTFGKELNTAEQGILSQAFGDEAMKLLKAAWGKGAEIQKNANDINTTSAKGLEFAKSMMNNMQDNFSDRADIQSQKWAAIQEQLGEALIPLLESLMPHLESLANWVSDFIKDNKGVAAAIGGTVLVVGGFLTMGGGLLIAMASLTGAAASATAALNMMALRAGTATALGGAGGIGGGKAGGKLGKFVKGSGYVAAALSAVSLADTWTDDKKTTGEKMDDTTEVAGGLAGMWGGAAAGAAIGSAVPLIGTAIGGLIGGALGYWGGSAAGDAIGDLWVSDDKAVDAAGKQDIQQNNNTKIGSIIVQGSADAIATGKAVVQEIKNASAPDTSFDQQEVYQ